MENRTLIAIPLMMGLVLLTMGCGILGPGPLRLEPGELCSDHSDDVIATFEDATLEAGIRTAPPPTYREFDAQDDLTCDRVSRMAVLQVNGVFPVTDRIGSLVGIQNLTSLEILDLDGNLISDISPLSGLTKLWHLWISDNSISDISALGGLTSLTDLRIGENSITDISPVSELTSLNNLVLGGNSITDISPLGSLTSLTALRLHNNPDLTEISVLRGLPNLGFLVLQSLPGLTDIQPLLDNTGLGPGDQVFLRATNVSCADVAALEAKAVLVDSDCP